MLEQRQRRIVLAADGSPSSDAALDLLCALRLDPHDRVEVVSVATRSPLTVDAGFDALSIAEEAAREIAQLAVERLARCGIAARCRVAEGPIAESIVDCARDTQADLIVAGSRGRGLIVGALLGSTARTLARISPVPVLIARERRAAPQRVLLAVDGSPDSRASIDALSALPLPRGAEIVVVHVVPESRADSTRSLDLLCLVASRMPPTFATRVEVAKGGDPAASILARAAALGSDLIVLGAGGKSGRLLQGSTTDRVLSGARCGVLTARAAERVKAEQPVRAHPVAQVG